MKNIFFSKVQQKLLGLFFCQPDKSFYTNEIIHLSKIGTGSVQRELKKLSEAGLILKNIRGNQTYYQVNKSVSFFSELRGLVLKTFGLADILLESLNPIMSKLKVAFIYGSVAEQKDSLTSDIDLMLIGSDISYTDIYHSLAKAESQLQRKINPTFYTPLSWSKKIKEKNNFVLKVIKKHKIFLIGNYDELLKLK